MAVSKVQPNSNEITIGTATPSNKQNLILSFNKSDLAFFETMEVVVRSDIQPGVIDIKILQEAIKEQGPKGEAGALMDEEGYDLKEIEHLRLEFLNILRIDHLWMMTGLTKLHLGNNIIEKIENLDALVNLKELDLSFNRIKVIENLQNLEKIEILTLFQNSISEVKNLECLKNLEIFSIGNNYIEDESCVLYLRQFRKLRSLNMTGNPCAHEGFWEYVAAFIPQLVYYEYKLLTEDQVGLARSKYLKELEKIERAEEQQAVAEQAAEERRATEQLHAEAFVEQLDKDQLSEQMIQSQVGSRALQLMGEDAQEIFNSFQEQVRSVTSEIFELGQTHLMRRKEELRQFNQCVDKAKNKSQRRSQEIVEAFTESKNEIFLQVQELVTSAKDKDADKEAIATSLGALIIEFNDLCKNTWKSLMGIELVLFEQMEVVIRCLEQICHNHDRFIQELNDEFEKNLGEMVSQFTDEAQVHFTVVRQHELMLHAVIQDLATRYLTSRRDKMPPELQEMMSDKETLNTALSACHDEHLQVIDDREERLITRVRAWHTSLCQDIQGEEISRNRATVLEINHFLDIQKEEFDMFNLDLGEDQMYLEDNHILSASFSTPRSGSLVQ